MKRLLTVAVMLVTLVGMSAAGAQVNVSARAAAAPAGLDSQVLSGRKHGQDAVAALGGNLDMVAARNGWTAAKLKQILRDDPTASVDPHGRVVYTDPALPAQPKPSAPVGKGPYGYSQTFLLHSKSGSSRVLYLDFNGEFISGTAWNSSYGLAAQTHPAFDTDGNPASFSASEQDVVQSVWQRVAEDYAAFDIDVTTQDPGAAAIDRSSAADTVYGTRVLISPSTTAHAALCSSGCGGIAFIDVFDAVAPNHATYQPAWVFPQALGPNDAKDIAEAASHEAGHNFGLSHDGTSTVGYYAGHGSWAPIMGVGYYEPIVQWSKGEYADANNTEDDLAIITSNGAPYRADDHGGSTAAATALGSGGAGAVLSRTGVITNGADYDYFSFTATCSGNTLIQVDPAPTSPDLDARLQVYNSSGGGVAYVDPTSGTVNTDVASGLNASTTLALTPGATYYLSVDGIGALNALNTGYSYYASIGQFTVTVRPCVGTVSGVVRDKNNNPLPNAAVSLVGTGQFANTNGAGAYTLPNVGIGNYTLQASGACKASQTRSITVASGTNTQNFTLQDASVCSRDSFSWIDGTTVLPLTGDDASLTVALPFAYRHYGVDYTTGYVSTNGFVNFLNNDATYSNGAIPNASVPNAAVYGFWDDLEVDQFSSVRTTTLGTAPTRRFVIEWKNVTLHYDLTRRFDFEIVLWEDRNQRVTLQYRNINANTSETGTSATVGRENAAGNSANQVSLNNGVLFDGLAARPK